MFSSLAGVVKEYRQNGIASFMLENLIAHLTSSDHQVRSTIDPCYRAVLWSTIKSYRTVVNFDSLQEIQNRISTILSCLLLSYVMICFRLAANS